MPPPAPLSECMELKGHRAAALQPVKANPGMRGKVVRHNEQTLSQTLPPGYGSGGRTVIVTGRLA